MGERKIGRETGAGEKKRERETVMGERKMERQEWERDRQRDRGGRERDKGERDKITNTKKSWNFILSCFTPQNGVKHDKCRATIHCRASIRLPETSWERKR